MKAFGPRFKTLYDTGMGPGSGMSQGLGKLEIHRVDFKRAVIAQSEHRAVGSQPSPGAEAGGSGAPEVLHVEKPFEFVIADAQPVIGRFAIHVGVKANVLAVR
jgi:hypothetical protein